MGKNFKEHIFHLKPKIIDISVSQHLLKLCSRTWVWAQSDPRFNYQYITKKSFKSMSNDRDHFTPLLLIISIINLTIYYVRPREELRGSSAVLYRYKHWLYTLLQHIMEKIELLNQVWSHPRQNYAQKNTHKLKSWFFSCFDSRKMWIREFMSGKRTH